MVINDLIFRELVKRGYSVKGKRKIWDIADSKLWYLTPTQAQSYLDFQAVTEYASTISSKEVGLIESNMSHILSRIGKGIINIVDLGCGDGKKAVIFVQALKKKKMKFRYCPIDISSHMVQKAIERISKLDAGEIMESHWNISDFENLENVIALLNNEGYKKNLFLLLGNTLGNFEMHEILYKIRNCMRDGDLLVIGNGLNDNKVEERVVKFCKQSPEFIKFFDQIPLQLGFEKGEFSFDARFTHSRIEFFHSILRDKKIKFGNTDVEFKKGDEIIDAFSYHLKKDKFNSLMRSYFNDVSVFVNKDHSYGLVVCRK